MAKRTSKTSAKVAKKPPTTTMKKAITTMKTKSVSKEEKGGDSPSRLIDARIKELSDWRGGHCKPFDPAPPLPVQQVMMKRVETGREEIARLKADAQARAEAARADVDAMILGTKRVE